EPGISRQLLLNKPGHSCVSRAGLLGVFKPPFRIERRESGKHITAPFLQLILQIANTVEAADGTSIKPLDLRVGPAQVMNDENANANNRYANRQASQGKTVLIPEGRPQCRNDRSGLRPGTSLRLRSCLRRS